jgi:Ca2+-binding EF-hand superfamily protein
LQLFGRLLFKFNKFAAKVRSACNGVHDVVHDEKERKKEKKEFNNITNNITNPEKTLEHIGVAVVATRKLALLILVFSLCIAGFYAAVILLEWVRIRVSFVIAPCVLVVDILTIELVFKVKPLPRRLNETMSARRYIKVGDGLGGVTGEEGTFDERVGDAVVAVRSSANDDDDASAEQSLAGLFSCCVCKASKTKKRREKKKRRRQQLRVSAAAAAAAAALAKVAPLPDQQVTQKTKRGHKVPLENPELYFAHGVDDALRQRFRRVFDKIDADGSESIDFDEFANYYRIAENANFVKRLFVSFQSLILLSRPEPNEDGKLVLYFQDFVLGLRQFLTMTKGQLICKAFELYDSDCSLSLDIAELREMVMDIWGNHATTESSRIHYIIEQMDPDKSGDCDIHEWIAACKKNFVLMKPAFNSQRTLREACFGTTFWEKIQKSDVEFERDMRVKRGKFN